MVTATITSKGQITIPKSIRDSLHLRNGDRVAFAIHGESEAVMRPLTRSVDEVFGRLHRRSQTTRSIKQMDEGIADLNAESLTMIAADTNVIVRFLVKDDEKQAAMIYRRLKRAEADRERIFIPLVVALEIMWVLKIAYAKTRDEVAESFRDMLRMSVLEFEKAGVIEKALDDARGGKMELADLLIAHAAREAGCERF